MKYDFEHYLQAGHGRAYVIARADPERYRDRIMSLPHEFGRKDGVQHATSEIVMSWIRKEPKIERSEMMARGLMTMSRTEALKFAEQFIIETDTDIKASIASVFTSGKYRWPLDAGLLVECAASDNPELPESLLTWAYESTLCSWCRKNIVEKMIKRGMLTAEIKEELRWDANLDISKMIDEDWEQLLDR